MTAFGPDRFVCFLFGFSRLPAYTLHMLEVAYQGVAGAYHEEALYKYFGEAKATGYPTFHEVFSAVTNGKADFGICAIENTIVGNINQTVDLLLESSLTIVGEVVLKIDHCLLAPKGTKLEDIRIVKSQPPALGQCDGFIGKHHLEAIPVFDTAGAAESLAHDPEPHVAAIASRRAAEHYGLDILAEAIQDSFYNFTRFLILAKKTTPREEKPYKTSIVFALNHRAGELVTALKLFSDRGVNMSKLESRPRRDRAFQYVFYMDLEGHEQDPGPRAALESLRQTAEFVKVLGSYPAWPQNTEKQIV